ARIVALQQEIAQLRATENLVAELCRDETSAASRFSGYEVEDEMQRNDLQRTQLLFEAMLKRLQDAKVANDTGGFEATVIAPPGSDGVKKAQPSGLLFASGGVLLGILMAGGFIAIAELRERRYRSVGEIRGRLNLPILGRIPALRRRRTS